MELFIRSIAYAGGVEVPADVRIFEPPRPAPRRETAAPAFLPRLLRRAGTRLADLTASLHIGPQAPLATR